MSGDPIVLVVSATPLFVPNVVYDFDILLFD